MTTSRTVVHLATSMGRGGTERQLLALLAGLDRRRWQPRLVCFRPEGEYLADVIGMGVRPEWLRLPPSLGHPGLLLTIGRLARRLREERATVLHCHDAWTAIVGVPAARLAGVPVIASRRDLGHHLAPAHRLLLRAAMAGASCVLTNAAAVAAQAAAEDGVPPGRLAIVENGIDLAEFDRRAGVLDGPAQPDPYVLCVGNMIHVAKGHADLIAAAALVKRVAPELRFVLVGGGELEPALRARAEAAGLGDTVIFAGERTDVPALLARAHIYCHPARHEGMPNAVLEAMAGSCAIVAATAGGVPELIGDGVHGRLVPTASPPALADAILELHRDPDRRAAFGRAARARVEERFTLARLVGRIDALYTTLARNGSRWMS